MLISLYTKMKLQTNFARSCAGRSPRLRLLFAVQGSPVAVTVTRCSFELSQHSPFWGGVGGVGGLGWGCICRSAEGRRAVTAARSVRGAAGRGSEWTKRAGVERGPSAHVSTDPPSFGPLNTLTLSGHTERRPPSLLSPPVPQRNGQREGGGQPETLSTSEPGARP